VQQRLGSDLLERFLLRGGSDPIGWGSRWRPREKMSDLFFEANSSGRRNFADAQ